MRAEYLSFIEQLKLRNYKPLTIEHYKYVFRKFGETPLTKVGLIDFQNRIQQLEVYTRRGIAGCLRQFLRQDDDSLLCVIEPVKETHKLPKPVPKQDDILQVLQKPDITTFKGIRDKSILEVLYSCWLRNSELRSLEVEDINFATKMIRVNDGKNSKDRVVPMTEECSKWLDTYINFVRPQLNPKHTTVFVGIQRGKKLGTDGLLAILKEYTDYTPHRFRHAYATHMLENGMKEVSIKHLLGHWKLKTTQVYAKLTLKQVQTSYFKYHDRDSWGFK